jgi:hypothetical protein
MNMYSLRAMNGIFILCAVRFCDIILLDCFVPRNDGGVSFLAMTTEALRFSQCRGDPAVIEN